MLRVTLGEEVPVVNWTRPLVTGPGGLQVWLMTVLNAEGYIYTYTNGGATGIVVGRALLVNGFDSSKYEFLKTDGTWVTGILSSNDTSYGCQGNVHSDGQGSIQLELDG
ncbi:hypothetical protein BDZ45DRAFT_668541 [Acephala macrosclerotiorum]|nr:hypothetical protein BDZ45DRAFT_668541 [Acephala macrosclerotiorum]